MRRATVVVALTCLPASARADGIRVEAEACGNLDTGEVERLVTLDLAAVLDERKDGFPPAKVTCIGDHIRIVIEDPVTAKRLERELPAPKGKGRERTFALAISQLYLTSWTELALPPPPEPVGPPKDAAGSKAATAIVKAKVAPPPGWNAEGALAGVVRSRGGHGLRDWGGTFRATALAPSGFGVFASLGFEAMRVERVRGNVDASIATIGLGGAYRSPGSLAIDARAGLSLAFVRVDGRPGSERTIAGGESGTAVDFAAALGPTLLVGPFRIGVEGQVGVLLPRVVADVRGEDPVRFHGAWIGGAAFVGLGFR